MKTGILSFVSVVVCLQIAPLEPSHPRAVSPKIKSVDKTKSKKASQVKQEKVLKFVPYSTEKQECSPELKAGELIAVWMPEKVSAYGGRVPLCLTIDLRDEKEVAKFKARTLSMGSAAGAEESHSINSNPGTQPFKAKHWLHLMRAFGTTDAPAYTSFMSIPLDYKKGEWIDHYPPGDESYGDGEYQGIDSEFKASPQTVPIKNGQLNYYSIDLADYGFSFREPGGEFSTFDALTLRVEYDGLEAKPVTLKP